MKGNKSNSSTNFFALFIIFLIIIFALGAGGYAIYFFMFKKDLDAKAAAAKIKAAADEKAAADAKAAEAKAIADAKAAEAKAIADAKAAEARAASEARAAEARAAAEIRAAEIAATPEGKAAAKAAAEEKAAADAEAKAALAEEKAAAKAAIAEAKAEAAAEAAATKAEAAAIKEQARIAAAEARAADAAAAAKVIADAKTAAAAKAASDAAAAAAKAASDAAAAAAAAKAAEDAKNLFPSLRISGWVKDSPLGGSLKQVSTDNNFTCGVNNVDEIFCNKKGGSDNWIRVDGSLKYVSVANKKFVGANSGNQVWYSEDTSNIPRQNGRMLETNLQQIDMDNTIMCGIDAGTVGYCKWSDLNWWYRIGNIDIKHISVSNGKLLALNTNNKVYYANEMKEFPDWKEITSGVNTQVDLNGTFACTVNKNGDGTYTTMCNENILNDASEWKEIPGNYKHISIGQLPTSKKYLYGIAPDNTAWKTTS